MFSNSEIPMFFLCSIVNEHYISISHMAIFVYMATQHWGPTATINDLPLSFRRPRRSRHLIRCPTQTFDIMPYSITAGCQTNMQPREIFQTMLTFTIEGAHACRPSVGFTIIRVHASQGRKGLLGVFFPEVSCSIVLYAHLFKETEMQRMMSRIHFQYS